MTTILLAMAITLAGFGLLAAGIICHLLHSASAADRRTAEIAKLESLRRLDR